MMTAWAWLFHFQSLKHTCAAPACAAQAVAGSVLIFALAYGWRQQPGAGNDSVGRRLFNWGRGQNWFRLILVQRCTAFSAKIVGGPELDQMTVVTSDHFPGIDRRQCCCHDDFGVPEQATSKNRTAVLKV